MTIKRNTLEKKMELGFNHLRKVREYFDKAIPLYEKRNDDARGDKENIENIKSAIHYLALAYDEVSAIWENDIIN
jgi:hypothetical protein